MKRKKVNNKYLLVHCKYSNRFLFERAMEIEHIRRLPSAERVVFIAIETADRVKKDGYLVARRLMGTDIYFQSLYPKEILSGGI